MLIILSAGAVGLASSARPSLCATLHAGFLRRQMQEFGWNQAFQVGMDPTHTPYVTFAAKGRNATVTIGDGNEPGGKYHVMIPSDVPSKIHFIGHIYVFDQNDEIIANRNLDPTDPSPATLTFSIPPGTKSITAYQFCNIHGLWKGEKTAVPLQYIFDAWGGDAWGGLDYGYKCSLHQPGEMCFMSHHAEMIRRQFFVFNKYAPFNKGKPSLFLLQSSITLSILHHSLKTVL
jgi:desulfoferrodoxin (superoxide reductase-like protein)